MSASTDLFTRLRDVARDGVKRLDRHPTAGRLVRGTLPAAAYAEYLAQVAHQVQGSSPMLRRAGRRLEALGRHPELAALLALKAGEEEGHDAWALDDLAALGVGRKPAACVPCCSAVKAYRAWTDHIAHHAPIAVLGVAFVLEWFGSRRAGRAADALVARGAIANITSAVRFLRGHGEADVSHVRALQTLIVAIEEPREAHAVLASASLTATLYLGLFDAVASGTSLVLGANAAAAPAISRRASRLQSTARGSRPRADRRRAADAF
jgi:hypothetical protein